MGSPKGGRRSRRGRNPKRVSRVCTTSAVSLSGDGRSSSKSIRQPSAKIRSKEMHYAASTGHVRWLQVCLQKTSSPTQADINGFSALHTAALRARLDCIQILVDRYGANVNLASVTGWRPIHLVISKENGAMGLECLKFLISRGAKVNVQNQSGVTPLHKAASEGSEKCVQVLIDAGADVHAKDIEGQKPIDLSRTWGHRACAKYLASAMWKIDKENYAREMCRLNEIKEECEMRRKEFIKREQMEVDFCNIAAFEEWLANKHLPRPSSRIATFLEKRHPSVTLQKFCKGMASPIISVTALVPSKAPHLLQKDQRQRLWNPSTNLSSEPITRISRSSTVRLGVDPEKIVDPDFTSFVSLFKNASGEMEIQIDGVGKFPYVPNLPFEDMEKSLYPQSWPPRMEVPKDFRSTNIYSLKHKRLPGPEHKWTDQMAMSLRQTFDPAFVDRLKAHFSTYGDPKVLSPRLDSGCARGKNTFPSSSPSPSSSSSSSSSLLSKVSSRQD
ncbi:ankyrin repeat domain-containing protein 53 isoform X2 [Sceloporus undulatus]|uniref:ankyrin repeat domain-containing protein 53 isoform X2 n=1 Tax=Sceloporus undulatus TaxID=8520 RepID=UPI001C4AF65A|nr:ankyrin repeat domain-containing protein 53 isoform X2 [Sceloporus undulatus]